MREIILTEKALDDLKRVSKGLETIFLKHFDKIKSMPPRRHMKHGIPFHVENVTAQARIIYYVEEEKIVVTHCFSDHKSYEKWFRSYR
jgi:mRNA-degrading endonuclease RelE of RelBE toxin-antitoxin system